MSKLRVPASIDTEACYRYTVEHQTAEGGFCFYAYRPWGIGEPNTPDTRAAVAILRILERPVPERERCVAWLRAQQAQDGTYSTLVIAYAALKALRELGAPPSADPRQYLRDAARSLGLMEDGREPTRWVEGALKCVELWQEWGMTPGEAMDARISVMLGRLRTQDGGFGAEGSSLPETAAAVALGAAAQRDTARAALAYVRRCEGLPYGFNVSPSSTASDLQSQRAAMWLLGRHGEVPRYPELVREFVAMCQTGTGGFGRNPGAIARLSDSLYALEILGSLAEEPRATSRPAPRTVRPAAS